MTKRLGNREIGTNYIEVITQVTERISVREMEKSIMLLSFFRNSTLFSWYEFREYLKKNDNINHELTLDIR
ncbi:hypothetical protein GCM10008934_38930 [Virgibacillus salarius]